MIGAKFTPKEIRREKLRKELNEAYHKFKAMCDKPVEFKKFKTITLPIIRQPSDLGLDWCAIISAQDMTKTIQPGEPTIKIKGKE